MRFVMDNLLLSTWRLGWGFGQAIANGPHRPVQGIRHSGQAQSRAPHLL